MSKGLFQYVLTYIMQVVGLARSRADRSVSPPPPAASTRTGLGFKTVTIAVTDGGGFVVCDPGGLLDVQPGEGALEALQRLLAGRIVREQALRSLIPSTSTVMAPVAPGSSTKAKADVPVEGLLVQLSAARRLVDRVRRMASPAQRQAIVDFLAGLLVCVGELVLWALLVVIYSGFVWIAWNELDVHGLLSHVIGTSVITYKQYLGIGFMIAFLSNAFTGRTDAIVKRAMRRVVSALL